MFLSLHSFDFKATFNNYTFLLFFTILSIFICLDLASNTASAGILEKTPIQQSKIDAEDFYQALTAEMYSTIGEDQLAVDHYFRLSASNTDPAIAKRVTELATVTGQIEKALDSAKRWVILRPKSLEANQYLTLLFLRNSYFKLSANQLDKIRQLIEESSEQVKHTTNAQTKFYSNESLTFIGALLAAEAHHDKAFSVFNLYKKSHISKIENYSLYQKQQRLITAQLAMKAKRYSAAIKALDGLNGLDAKNHVDAIVMQAKALHKLRQNEAAIKQLQSVQNNPQANDSHRLELVRLLVLEKQKDVALPILEALVLKHPKNLDLLKSLIALQIDQSQLAKTTNNIKKLRSNAKYINEADYFFGEFAEKLGQREKALESYKKVIGGSYLKNAHKKIISLIRIIYGEKELNKFFDGQQRNASKISNQAYWIKLQADDFFEIQQYEKALALYDKAITLAPKKVRYRYKRGLVNERLGKLDFAENDFNFVLTKQKNNADALNALGYMLSVHTQRLSEAKKYVSKAYKLKPNDPLILDSLGFVFYKTGELTKAEKYLRKAFRLMKKPEVASHLITVLAKSNKHQEAKNIFLEMQKIFPNSPSLKEVSQYLP